MHALYCAYAAHEWTALSTRSDQVAENILKLKRSIHKMVAGHQALRDLFRTRWLASLTTSGPPTQLTFTEYMHALFARVKAAHPAQGFAPADWGGFPEFAAASACWNKPVYILHEQPVKDTWWLWVVRYCPGDKRIDTWVRHETAELDGMQYESPIRTKWSRSSQTSPIEWGQHLLLSNCYTTMSAVICLTPTELYQHTVEEWKQASIDALTMEEALRVALDPSAWHDHLIPPTNYSGVFNPAFLTALTPPHQLWLAIIAALLDKEGMEEDDLPEKLTLADLHNLAHIDRMLSIIDHLVRGKWGPFWTWIQTNAYAWGYSEHPDHLRVLSQNVNGFRLDTVHAWMASWKAQLTHSRLDAICIQETHVGSTDAADKLTMQWNKC
ncbi:hypothetical protein DYB28_004153 [Aphanomyces astaci]|uniref:Endonuclease/exonuclease/phosphatase domain-containing protein n=1 Tax=Aphanomyces astaci TaxID=112090 RepID=A0A9X8E2J6_APHAT|nr:hypothetical protein DYB28_004153 [Aphanomyces astaci]